MDALKQVFQNSTFPDECIEWQGAKSTFGHGRMKRQGTLVSPHRVVYESINGPLAESELVLHHCDHPGCVNPKHLFKGSYSDNMKDCAAKGRLSTQIDPSITQGERRSTSKLTDDGVREIRRLAGSVRVKDLAAKFGVHRSIIQKVIKRQRWAHVTD